MELPRYLLMRVPRELFSVITYVVPVGLFLDKFVKQVLSGNSSSKQLAATGNDSLLEVTSPSAEPQREQKQRLYL